MFQNKNNLLIILIDKWDTSIKISICVFLSKNVEKCLVLFRTLCLHVLLCADVNKSLACNTCLHSIRSRLMLINAAIAHRPKPLQQVQANCQRRSLVLENNKEPLRRPAAVQSDVRFGDTKCGRSSGASFNLRK